ncbi:MAG TPA: hypothetical protein VK747_23800 [Blastocatellia bacterium]|nr:hypothetical protein [Blastocatellia bacterium]
MAITLGLALPVTARPIKIAVVFDIGRKKFDCTRAGVCKISIEASAASAKRPVKANAEITGRSLQAVFEGPLPEKGNLLPIDENIVLDEETAKALGFKTVTVLKGNYRLTRAKPTDFGTVKLNVKTTK